MRKAATSPGIAGNDLNRCDAPALQHKIRANSKRIAVFFVDSRLRVVQTGGGGWKRVALDGNEESFVRKKCFWFAKKLAFSAHTRLSDKEKTFFSAQRHRLRTTPKLTSNCKFYLRQPTVSLQYNNSFSKKQQSCVCTTVTLSHRFKAFSPAFCGQNRFRHELPEISAKSLPADL